MTYFRHFQVAGGRTP